MARHSVIFAAKFVSMGILVIIQYIMIVWLSAIGFIFYKKKNLIIIASFDFLLSTLERFLEESLEKL
jgi:hypothetical protein